jgi:Fe-S cluster assembly protein SufD
MNRDLAELSPEQERYLSQFSSFARRQADRDPPWLMEKRQAAMRCFTRLGFPTTHDEAWRFTSLRPLTRVPFAHAGALDSRPAPADLDSLTGEESRACRLVFLNARFSREHSSFGHLPPGVRVQGLAELLNGQSPSIQEALGRYAGDREEVFAALNTAFLEDIALVYLPRNTVVEQPIHLHFYSGGEGQPVVSHPRCLVLAGANSQARIVETYTGEPDSLYFTNTVTELVAQEGAVVEHYKLQQESVRAFHVATLQFQLGRSAKVSSHSISLGGALVRNHVNAVLDGEGAEATLNGFSLTTGGQHVDNHTSIDHAKPHCNSFEFYKGILDDHSRGVFNGRIIVRPHAQKTDSKQTNQNLLLSEEALINTNPQLEIYADDVRCTHGATIGQLDPQAIFYLQSRGIGREAARQLLTFAFANDITSQIRIEPIRSRLEKTLFHRLAEKEPKE